MLRSESARRFGVGSTGESGASAASVTLAPATLLHHALKGLSGGLEVVLVEPVGDLLAEDRPLDVGCAEVDSPQTRASITSLMASEKRSKVLGVRDLLLKMVNGILSVPKKFWSVWTIAIGKLDLAAACKR